MNKKRGSINIGIYIADFGGLIAIMSTAFAQICDKLLLSELTLCLTQNRHWSAIGISLIGMSIMLTGIAIDLKYEHRDTSDSVDKSHEFPHWY